MDIEFFHNVFATVKGYVYQYVGSLDGVESIPHHVTERFAVLNNNNLINASVVEIKPGLAVLYVPDLYPDNDEFKLLHDLLMKQPENVVVIPPQEQAIVDTPPTE